jgi:MIP family channel proteins
MLGDQTKDAEMTASTTLLTPIERTNVSASRRHVGLHGHPLEANMARASVAEAIGTFVLVLTIISTVVAASLDRSVAGTPYGSLAVPVAGGLALAIMVASLGHISGAHLNPAVTFGLAVNRRFPWPYVPTYIIAQLGGAIAAALVAWSFYGDTARSGVNLGATYPAVGVPVWRALSAEAVVTFVLVLVVVSVATDGRVPAGVAALAIGSALAAAILISGPISGAAVNPVRALGPMIVAGKFTDWWAYVIAPLIGGILATTAYDRILRRGSTPT